MEVLIASIGIVVALVLILAIMNHRARRAGRSAGLDDRAVVDARYYNDTRAQQQ
jgi:preprotein translocase subunit SecG